MSEAKMDITQKTENIFKVLRFLESQIWIMKDEKKYIDWRKKSIENNIERIRKLMQMWLDTVWTETDKKGKKTQKVKTLKGSIYYIFKENVSYNNDEIDKSYIIKKKKIVMTDEFSLEKLLEMKYKWVKEVGCDEIDYEKLRFDYDRAIKNNDEAPKWITIWEDKTLCIRK
jgi:hypothetical protein